MRLLKKYKGLSNQAEDIDTYESYKELINTIRDMTYEELFNIMWDTETALKVLVRGESKARQSGILSLTEDIVKLGKLYLEKNNYPPNEKPDTEYTYEFLDNRYQKNMEIKQ